MQQKIQCPNCGATTNLKEKLPSTYQCGYCESSFEQLSIVPNTNLNQSLSKQLAEIYEECLQLKPERAKYHERMVAGVLQMSSLIDVLTDSKAKKEAFLMLEALIARELELYKETGISVLLFSNERLLSLDSDKLVKGAFLKQLLIIKAHHLCQISDDGSDLKNAFETTRQALQVKVPTDTVLSGDLRRIHFGLLRRLEGDAAGFTFLEHELEKATDQEQFHYDYEDVFLSEAYKNYQKTKNQNNP